MATLNIPLASPVFFVYITTGSAIRTGETIVDNALYPNGTEDCGVVHPNFSQPYNCDDVIELQIEYDNSGLIPWVQVMNNDGTIAETLIGSLITGNFYKFDIDWGSANLDCPACYYLRYISPTEGSSVLACGDNGTFETGTYASFGVSTGGTNVGSKSSTQARTGTYSARIASPMMPSVTESDILGCTAAFSLSADTFYRYSAYVYDDGTDPFVADNRGVLIDISAFSDAITISQTIVTPSVDGRDVWHLVDIVFRTGSDISGVINITTSAAPQALGFIYVDDMALGAYALVEEALSNNIQLKTDHKCTELVEYYNDSDSMNQIFSSGFVNTIRLPLIIGRPTVVADNTVFVDSIGTRSKIASYLSRVYPVEFGYLPDYMVQTVQIALEHDHFEIESIEYISEDNYEPVIIEKYALRKGALDMFVANYDLQNTLC